MRRNDKLLILVLIVITVVALVTVFVNDQNPFVRKPKETYKAGVDTEVDSAVNQARKVFQQKKELGLDMTHGPCLTNDLLPDWVLDIVHNPRQTLDNLPQNQCQAYVEGRAKHFVELDADGNVIRAF